MLLELLVGAAVGAYVMNKANSKGTSSDPVSRAVKAAKAGIESAKDKWNNTCCCNEDKKDN